MLHPYKSENCTQLMLPDMILFVVYQLKNSRQITTGGGAGFEPATSRLKGDNPNSAAFSGEG